MDTPDKAAGLADSQVADVVNKEWLMASARSSQLSIDLARYRLDWSSESSGRQHASGSNYYGATSMVTSGPDEATNSTSHLRSRQWEQENGSASAPPPGDSSWLVRHQFWPTKAANHLPSSTHDKSINSASYTSNTYAINGHLYDNISFADTPLLRSISDKRRPLATDATRAKRARERHFCAGRFRILLASFVLLGITLANYSRNALSLAAVGMIASNAVNRELVNMLANATSNSRIHSALDGSCPIDQHFGSGNFFASTSDNSIASSAAGPLLFDSIQMGPQARLENALNASSERRDQLESEFRASIRLRVEAGELVDWSPSEQGLISAAGSVGNLLIAIPLTRMGEIHGPKWIIFVASLGASLQAAFMPLVSTSCNVILVILFQVIFNGLTYGADCVAYTLFAHWLTPTEMAFFVSCLIICYQLGTMMSSFVTAKILSHALHWCWCFYAPAALCALWTLVWALVGASEPRHSRLISRAELAYLSGSSKIAQTLERMDQSDTLGPAKQDCRTQDSATSGSHPVSWWKLARDPNIWAVIAVKFTLRWYFSVYLSLMPTYLSSVAHMSVETIGSMSVAQSFIGLFCGILMGYLTKSLVSRRPLNMSLACTRKWCQSIVNFGLALSLLVFIIYDCNEWLTIAALTFSGLCISFYVAGALQIPLDMSPTHCGLITSITNTLALGQALGAPISGLILNGGPKERSRWRIVWSLAIVMNTLSGLIFILLVDAKPRDYNKYPQDRGSSETNARTTGSRPLTRSSS